MIANILHELYKTNKKPIWHQLLEIKYEHACQILVEIKARYPSKYSDWLLLQDSFNDIIVRKLFEFLETNNLPGYSKTIGRNGELVQYGILLQENKAPFNATYPDIASPLRKIHKCRNKMPNSHPYDLKYGSQNTWLTKQERNDLAESCKVALNKISTLVEQYI